MSTQARGTVGLGAASAFRWSGLSLAGRQFLQTVFAVILARMLGPQGYGVTGIISVYSVVTMVLLDQGLASALIQRPKLSDREPGAALTINVVLAVVLGALTAVGSPWIAEFFRLPTLSALLAVAGAGLVFKGLAVVPRAMLSRALRFRPMAYADIIGAAVGCVLGFASLLLGVGPWAIVIQIGTMDAYVCVHLLVAGRGPRPNLAFRELAGLFGFSIKIFGSNVLSTASRNVDDVLVGRYLGASALAFYGIGYRVLLMPTQMLSAIVNRVLYPIIARCRSDLARVRSIVTITTTMFAFGSIPALALAIWVAPLVVPAVFGEGFRPAIPVVQILAITGARQLCYSITPTLMTGMGRADWQFRFALSSIVLQVGGIVLGLHWGIVGVATGYTVAGVLATVMMIDIQRRLIGLSWRRQLGLLAAPLHATAWASVGYWIPGRLGAHGWWAGGLGTSIFVVVFVAAVIIFHRSTGLAVWKNARRLWTAETRTDGISSPV